jgi:hypothetical protein
MSPVEEALYYLLDDVPEIPEEFGMPSVFGGAPFGAAPFAGGYLVTDEMLARLREILPDENDARHIFQAAQNDIGYFITCDERTILRHTVAIEAAAPIRPRLPSQVLAEIAPAPTS